MQKLCIIMHFEKIYTFVHSFFALKFFASDFRKIFQNFSKSLKNLSKFV